MKTLSVKKYVGIYVASFIVLIIPPAIALAIIAVINKSKGGEPSIVLAAFGAIVFGICLLQFIVIQVGTYFWLIVKMWKPLQDGVTPVTVGKAIGFSLIPIYRIYWHFIAWGSYPQEYNNFIRRHNLPVAPISDGIFKAISITLLLGDIFIIPQIAIPFLVVGLIKKVCEANNALIAVRLGQFDANQLS
jgi:hypothetical protein